MIVELNGVPGVGKTTLVNMLVEHYSKDVKMNGVSDFSKEFANKLNHKLVLFFRCVQMFAPHELCLSMYLFRVALFNIRDVPFKETVINIGYLSYLHRCYRRNSTNLLLVDEGILQATCAFIVGLKALTDCKTIYHHVFDYFKHYDVTIVEITLANDEVLTRINTRARKKAYIDYFDSEELNLFLSNLETEINNAKQVLIEKGFNIVSFNSNDLTKDTVDIIINSIM